MAGPFGRAKVDYMLRPWTATNTEHRSQQPFQVPPLLHRDTRGDVFSNEVGGAPGTLEVVLAPSAADGRPAYRRFSLQYAIAPVLRTGGPPQFPSHTTLTRYILCPVEFAERPMNHLAARVTTRWGTHSRSATVDLGRSAPLARERLCSKFDALTRPVFGQRASELRVARLGFSKAADTREALDPVLDAALFTVRQGAGPYYG
jgi:hypothetical protein